MWRNPIPKLDSEKHSFRLDFKGSWAFSPGGAWDWIPRDFLEHLQGCFEKLARQRSQVAHPGILKSGVCQKALEIYKARKRISIRVSICVRLCVDCIEGNSPVLEFPGFSIGPALVSQH